MWFSMAAGAAICFGVRGILYQWTSQRRLDRNLLLLGVYFSGTLISLVLNLYTMSSWTAGVWLGVPMGLFSFIANGAMYKGFAVGKASVIALFTALPPVVVVVVAFALWKEALDATQLIGFAIVMAGILLIRYAPDIKPGQFRGWQWGVLAMGFFGLTDISSKQATIFEAATLPVLTVMYGTGSLLFASMYWRSKMRARAVDRAAIKSDSRAAAVVAGAAIKCDSRDGLAAAGAALTEAGWTTQRTFLWGLFVGISNIAGMIFIVSAFRDGVTGIVSAITALNVVVILLYARFYLQERLSRKEILGIVIALAGILAIRLAS